MGFFNQRNEPTETPKPSPAINHVRLAKLVKGVCDGKVIQMCYMGSGGWGDMADRPLEMFLEVFLQPRDAGTDFRVKPDKLPYPFLEVRKHNADMNDRIIATLESHQKQLDNLYSLILNKF